MGATVSDDKQLEADVTALMLRMLNTEVEPWPSPGSWSVDDNGVVALRDSDGVLRAQMPGTAFIELRRESGNELTMDEIASICSSWRHQ
jgi:hypothetical protein